MIVVVIPLQNLGLPRGLHCCVNLYREGQANLLELPCQAKAFEDAQSLLAQPKALHACMRGYVET